MSEPLDLDALRADLTRFDRPLTGGELAINSIALHLAERLTDTHRRLEAAERDRDRYREALNDAEAVLGQVLTALERSSPADPGYGEIKYRQDATRRGLSVLRMIRAALASESPVDGDRPNTRVADDGG